MVTGNIGTGFWQQKIQLSELLGRQKIKGRRHNAHNANLAGAICFSDKNREIVIRHLSLAYYITASF